MFFPLPLAAVAAELHQLGQEVQAKVPPAISAGENEIPALGRCQRPTAEERIVLRTVVAKGVADDDLGGLAFGCMDARGVIVTVAYDQNHTGVWEVKLVAGNRATTLASYRGLSRMDYSEWANEVSIDVGLLVDLDGDGVHDALLVRTTHEGGAMHSDQDLSVWFSKSGRTVPSGTFGDAVVPARGQLEAPIVLEVERMNDPVRYRCLEANGTIDLCPEIETARHVDRVVELAQAIETTGDRDLLAAQLDEIGVEPHRRAHLLQLVPETTRDQRITRAIAKFVEPKPVRTYGEIVDPQPPDPRIAQIWALAGDAPCTMTTADQRALAAQLAADATITAACGDRHRGYVTARWTHSDDTTAEMTAREVVYSISDDVPTALVDGSLVGSAVSCAACGTEPPGTVIESSFYRHGASLVAALIDRSHDERLVSAVDGKLVTTPPGKLQWAMLFEPGSELLDVVETGGTTGERFWHWDGAWTLVAEVPFDATDAPASLGALGRRLWQESARFYALTYLQKLDPRHVDFAESLHRLTLAGADAATLARIRAL